MFKKFFKYIAAHIKAYVKLHGLIASICNAVKGAILSSGVAVLIINAFKRWKVRRKFKKMINDQGIDEQEYYNNLPVHYDENGYRMTNDELYAKNMREFKNAEKLYSDNNRECVAIIEKFDDKLFRGMNDDQKFEYVDSHKLNPNDLRKKYGLDKESQLKKHYEEMKEKANNEDIDLDDGNLQELWDQPESSKVGIASKVSKDYKKSENIYICNPIEYAAMEITYGCDDFDFANPNSETEIRRLRRMKFESAVDTTCYYMNYVYKYDKKLWNHWMTKSKNNPVGVWKFIMIAFLDNDEFYNEIHQFTIQKAEELNLDKNGNKKSNRPKITNIQESRILDKMEDLLERVNNMEFNKKSNTPNNEVVSTETAIIEDTDEEDDNDYILDQLDALRSGKITSTDEEISSESEDTHPIERKAVKMKTREDLSSEDDESNPEVIAIAPQFYTIDLRAQRIIVLFDKLHKDDPRFADVIISNMLEDEEGKNYAYYEKSKVMREYRKADREHSLAWKMVASDYSSNEERHNVLMQYQSKMNEYGIMTWKGMVEERTEYYREKFEYDTVDAILNQLPDSNLSHEAQIALLSCLINCEHNYVISINASKCADMLDEAKAYSREFTQDVIDSSDEDDSSTWIEA